MNEDDKLLYNLTFRFEDPPNKNIFFLELNSYNENRKLSNGRYDLHQTQIYGDFELKKGKLKLNYSDSVVNHRYCKWVLSNIGSSEEIPFYYNLKEDHFKSKINDKERIFLFRKKAKIDPKYFENEAIIDEKDCEFFTKLLGSKKGFF